MKAALAVGAFLLGLLAAAATGTQAASAHDWQTRAASTASRGRVFLG